MLMRLLLTIFGITIFTFIGCESDKKEMKKIIFLHHSTGYNVWVGTTNRYVYKLTKKGDVQKYFSDYNRKNKTNYSCIRTLFPQRSSIWME